MKISTKLGLAGIALTGVISFISPMKNIYAQGINDPNNLASPYNYTDLLLNPTSPVSPLNPLVFPGQEQAQTPKREEIKEITSEKILPRKSQDALKIDKFVSDFQEDVVNIWVESYKSN